VKVPSFSNSGSTAHRAATTYLVAARDGQGVPASNAAEGCLAHFRQAPTEYAEHRAVPIAHIRARNSASCLLFLLAVLRLQVRQASASMCVGLRMARSDSLVCHRETKLCGPQFVRSSEAGCNSCSESERCHGTHAKSGVYTIRNRTKLVQRPELQVWVISSTAAPRCERVNA
jgi:hypothetical protein